MKEKNIMHVLNLTPEEKEELKNEFMEDKIKADLKLQADKLSNVFLHMPGIDQNEISGLFMEIFWQCAQIGSRLTAERAKEKVNNLLFPDDCLLFRGEPFVDREKVLQAIKESTFI